MSKSGGGSGKSVAGRGSGKTGRGGSSKGGGEGSAVATASASQTTAATISRGEEGSAVATASASQTTAATISRGEELRIKYGDKATRSDKGRKNLIETGRPEQNATNWLRSVTRFRSKGRKAMGKEGRKQASLARMRGPEKVKVNTGSKPITGATPGSQTNKVKKDRTNSSRSGVTAARKVVGKAKRSKDGKIRFERQNDTPYQGY